MQIYIETSVFELMVIGIPVMVAFIYKYMTTIADRRRDALFCHTASTAKQKLQQYDKHIDDNQRSYGNKNAMIRVLNEVSMCIP
jgi:hypothetical protein